MRRGGSRRAGSSVPLNLKRSEELYFRNSPCEKTQGAALVQFRGSKRCTSPSWRTSAWSLEMKVERIDAETARKRHAMHEFFTTNPVLFDKCASQSISPPGLFFGAVLHALLPLDITFRCGLSAGILAGQMTALLAERSPKQLGPARLKSGGHIVLGGRARIVRFQGGPEAGFRTAKVFECRAASRNLAKVRISSVRQQEQSSSTSSSRGIKQ